MTSVHTELMRPFGQPHSKGAPIDRGNRPTVVCVTPVRNEAWTLARFLQCAETWADVIVIADQGSTDGTREIAQASAKTIVVSNDSQAYDEGHYRRVLLDAARTVPGPRAIISLDADEALSANVIGSVEWERALRSDPGTIFTAEWINYLPGAQRVWAPKDLVVGMIDDGREHSSGRFHIERIAVKSDDRRVSLGSIKALHFQYLDWERMKAKQRRYQCDETLHKPTKRAVQLYRQYHRMDAVPRVQVRDADPLWLEGYARRGIDMTSVTAEPYFWTDEIVLDLLAEHGVRRFRRLDIWDVDWVAIAAATGHRAGPSELDDPRSGIDKLVLEWLRATQRRHPERWATRAVDYALRAVGW